LLLAEDLEVIGEAAEALSVWTELAAKAPRPLFALLAMEALQRAAEDWRAVLATLQRQRALVTTDLAQAAVEAAIVQLLGTHLSDSDEAYAEYGRLVDANPSDRSIAAKYARMAGVRGETSTAVATLTRLGETAESPKEAARYRALLGDMLRNTGDADGARQAYLDALDHAPGHTESLSGLRALAEDDGDSGALLAVLNRELAAAPDDTARAAKLVEIADVTAEQDDADPSIVMDAWRAVLDAEPDNQRAAQELTDLADAFEDAATFDFAGSLLVRHLTGDARTDLLRKLGGTALLAGSRDAAVRWLEQAVNAEPPDLTAARELEPLYEASNNWSGLQTVLAMRKAAGDDVAGALAKAADVALRKQGDPAAADALYTQLLDIEPANAAALKYRADRAFADKDFVVAAELFTRLGDDLIGERDMDDFDDRLEASLLYYRYGVALVHAGRKDEAVGIFEHGLELDGTHLPSLEQIAPLYRSAGDYERASDAYRRILQLARSVGDEPGMASMYVELGLVDHANKDDERAAKRFGKALELDSNHAPALLGMALIYEEQGEFDNCWKSYNSVIHNASNRDGVILAYLRKGRVLDERKERLDKAAEHYERCLEVEPSQTVALVRLAEILTRLNRAEDALSVATRALDIEGIEPALQADLHAVLAYVYAGKDDRGAAEKALAAATAADESIAAALGQAPLEDLEAMSLALRRRLPVT
jgi:tetratricopeptide (TPR) repeat protein